MSTESSKASNVSTKVTSKSAAKAATRAEARADAKAEANIGAEAPSADAPVQLPLPPWVRRVAALAAIAIGWGFIAWHNRYITPASVILAIGWAAGVSTLYFLWRVGAAGGEAGVVREDWWLAVGHQEELEREKRALLKSIREIEFDQQTGKLSPHDAQEMTQVVRVRAIEVMKALDAVEQGGGARAEIEREVRARLEIEKARKVGAAAKKGKAGEKAVVKPVPKNEAKNDAKVNAASAKPSQAKSEAKDEANDEAKPGANADVKSAPEVESARSATAINAAPAVADEPAPLEPEAPSEPGESSDPSESSDLGKSDEPSDGVAVANATPPSGPKSSEVSA